MTFRGVVIGKRAQIMLVFATVFALSAFISLIVYKNYPVSLDEYAYLYQAKIFSQGELHLQVEKSFKPYVEKEMVFNKGWVFSKYPPGTSLLLSLGDMIGYAGLVNPFLSALSAVVVLLTLRYIVPETLAFTGAMLFGTNALFLGYAGSYFSQPAALFFVAIGFWILTWGIQRNYMNNWLGGTVIACAIFVRQVDAFCLLGSMLAALRKMRPHNALYQIAILGFLSLIGLLGLCYLQYLISGGFHISMAGVWRSDFKLYYKEAGGFGQNLIYVGEHYLISAWNITIPLFIGYFCNLVGPGLLIGVILGYRLPRDTLGAACLTFIISMVAIYNVHRTIGWPQYGVRYWYPCLVPLTLMAARGYNSILEIHLKHIWVRIIAFFFIWQAATLAFYLPLYAKHVDNQRYIVEKILSTCAPDSLVILNGPHNLKRNPLIDPGDLRFDEDYHGMKFMRYDELPFDRPGLGQDFDPGPLICPFPLRP